MDGTTDLTLVRIGIVAGLVTCIVYPVVVIAPVPRAGGRAAGPA